MSEKSRILIVDDDDSTRRTLRMIFGREGYETTEAATGREALTVAGRQPADLVLLDIRLPDMEGVELLAPLKALDPDMVVMIVTGNASLDSALQALNQGALAYFTKPLDVEALLTRITGSLERQRLVRENRRLYQEAQRELLERKRAETALVEERSLLRTVIDNLPDSIYAKDAESRFVLGNTAVAHLMGAATPGELLGKRDFDFHPQELAEQYYADEQEVIRSGEPLINRGERLMDLATGREGWQSTTKVPWRDSRGEVVGIVGIGRNITARKRAEEERELLLAQIQQQAQQLGDVMSTVPEGVLLLDAKGQIILANPAAESDLATLADAKAGDIITHLGDRPLAELLTSPPTQGLWHDVAADSRTFEIIARPMGSGPEPENWVLVINDATQEREIQRRIQQQERLAAVGQLAAG
ncbi:MAG: response regulator, partial [Anaerolineae bacterium]|nr:response regulator [Anaerolineae bacterium]